MTLGELPLAPVTPLSEAVGDSGYVMTLDADGWPTALGRPGSADAGLSPAVLLPASMTMAALCTGGALDLLALNPYGALVHDGGRTLGVLEQDTVSAYLVTLSARGTLRGDTPAPLDAVLAGAYATPAARVVCRCGLLTTLTAYDADFPPSCPGPGPDATPHPLAIRAE
ncbi:MULTISPECIES: hypothetical protein [Streptomyces]|uniref:Uncharacterized protein n=1 Tax=Streptomyces venezuelae (strain ATCC 10712 / CBS 650.69 / DSM 40230 / JCM 4526 / NBRC 13096 / PD 04745) TaxID=953739 RepID=F2R379_STRVP|nr:hypothetical protein [Streptomyces venezuelae]APE19567.1 hypothetical protein vnz_00150 [Streptomyces venezuelae]QER96981.1 hypothetical protein DEJ43_00155 [Streptomyces venezuelae ATCC 10712]CCA53325.1 hypothetical protein SVEN_0037 [Streptomyces venezuelae ATCC 10712]